MKKRKNKMKNEFNLKLSKFNKKIIKKQKVT